MRSVCVLGIAIPWSKLASDTAESGILSDACSTPPEKERGLCRVSDVTHVAGVPAWHPRPAYQETHYVVVGYGVTATPYNGYLARYEGQPDVAKNIEADRLRLKSILGNWNLWDEDAFDIWLLTDSGPNGQ